MPTLRTLSGRASVAGYEEMPGAVGCYPETVESVDPELHHVLVVGAGDDSKQLDFLLRRTPARGGPCPCRRCAGRAHQAPARRRPAALRFRCEGWSAQPRWRSRRAQATRASSQCAAAWVRRPIEDRRQSIRSTESVASAATTSRAASSGG